MNFEDTRAKLFNDSKGFYDTKRIGDLTGEPLYNATTLFTDPRNTSKLSKTPYYGAKCQKCDWYIDEQNTETNMD